LNDPQNFSYLIFEIKSLKIELMGAIQLFPNLHYPPNVMHLILEIMLTFNLVRLALSN